jgi:hypothetical protein
MIGDGGGQQETKQFSLFVRWGLHVMISYRDIKQRIPRKAVEILKFLLK